MIILRFFLCGIGKVIKFATALKFKILANVLNLVRVNNAKVAQR